MEKDKLDEFSTKLANCTNDKEKQLLRLYIEQTGGRIAILLHKLSSALDGTVFQGKEELQRRFGDQAVLAVSWEIRDDEVWVDVLVLTPDGETNITFTEYLNVFPSEEMIANIALVV